MCKTYNYDFKLIYARYPSYSVPWYMRDTHLHACIQTSLSSISCKFLVEDCLGPRKCPLCSHICLTRFQPESSHMHSCPSSLTLICRQRLRRRSSSESCLP